MTRHFLYGIIPNLQIPSYLSDLIGLVWTLVYEYTSILQNLFP